MHVSEEDLILHYYGEAEAQAAEVRAHLSSCGSCREELLRLQRVLALVEEHEIPVPSAAFERTVWARLQPQLGAQKGRWFRRVFHAPPRWAFAGGLATLLLAAFVAGRWSSPVPTNPPSIDDPQPSVADRVLMVAVVDHLDRSQMVLVELLNADIDAASGLQLEQSRARELVASNRLYRQTAGQVGDAAVTGVLEELERVLLEIANAPAGATEEELDTLRTRITSGGVLFRVRVVQSEMRERERQNNRVIG